MAGDPRLSLEERYGTQEGYACTTGRATEGLVRERFLLRADADRVIAEAASSHVLPTGAESNAEQRAIAETLCR